ncbi:unnamed protein product [Cochlearia groenlandica]
MSSTWKEYSRVDIVINNINENKVMETEENVINDNELVPSPMDHSERVTQSVGELQTTKSEVGVDKEVKENSKHVGGNEKLFDNADAVKKKRKGKVANEDGKTSKVIDDDNAKLVDVVKSLKLVREHVKNIDVKK